MERHVEERFERIEYILEESAKRQVEFQESMRQSYQESDRRQKEFQERFDKNLEGMRRILQDTITLSRENRMRIHNSEGER